MRDRLEEQGWLLHGQSTFMPQLRPAFHALDNGASNMRFGTRQRNTLSASLTIGRALWPGAEFIIDPQVSRGFGLSGTHGLAAFRMARRFASAATTP